MKKERRARFIRYATAATMIAVYISMAVRTTTYRKVIYSYQRLTETTDTEERRRLQSEIERRVGRAHYPYDRLPERPRYINFWGEYNGYGTTTYLYNDKDL